MCGEHAPATVLSARAVVTAARAASGEDRASDPEAKLKSKRAHFESCLKTLLNLRLSFEAGACQLTLVHTGGE